MRAIYAQTQRFGFGSKSNFSEIHVSLNRPLWHHKLPLKLTTLLSATDRCGCHTHQYYYYYYLSGVSEKNEGGNSRVFF